MQKKKRKRKKKNRKRKPGFKSVFYMGDETVNYIGSKHSLMDFLTETVWQVAGNDNKMVFADLFAGTGAVGSRFKEMGYRVIANDIQYYSYVLNRHLIGNNPPLNAEKFAYLNELEGVEGFVFKNYCAGSGSGRNYFKDENGKKCDAVRKELERLKNSGEASDAEYYYLLASLINSIDKYANTASVYGAFLKNIKKTAAKDFKLELLPVIGGNEACKVYNEDIKSLIRKIKGDILYLDPPYNSRQYCANYHVLETVARYDNPKLRGKTGLREYSVQKSEFCSSKAVLRAFEYIIRNADFKYIFLSYNNEGLMSFCDIENIMKKYGDYKVYMREYKRFKADNDEKRNHKDKSTVEYLHCLVKN